MRDARAPSRALGLALALLSAGCTAHRGPNQLLIAAARIAPSNSTVEGDRGGVVGQAGVVLVTYETDDEITHRARVDGWAGGNVHGGAGELRLEGEVGIAPHIDGDHYGFARAGLATELEHNPHTGMLRFDVPVIVGGYQYHDGAQDTPFHIEVGPRLALAVAGRASTESRRASFVAAPDVGGHLAVFGEAFAMEIRYGHVFERRQLGVGRATLCAALLLALCVEGRVVHAPFAPGRRDVTTFFGVQIGVGIATGLEHNF